MSRAQATQSSHVSPGFELLDPPVASTREPPFPSTSTIPSQFLFLVHISRSNPDTWGDYSTDAALDQRRMRTPPVMNASGDFPGVYTTLITKDNLATVNTFHPPRNSYILIFALDLLKQRNWHINFQDMFGRLGEHTTYFPWEQDAIAAHIALTQEPGVTVTGRSFNEVVFHDGFRVRPFLRHVIPIPSGTTQNTTHLLFSSLGRQEIQPGGVMAELDSSLPLYCYPPSPPYSKDYHEQHNKFPPSSSEWRQRMYDTCQLRLRGSNTSSLSPFFANFMEKTALSSLSTTIPSKNMFLHQTEYLQTHRNEQNFVPLLSITRQPLTRVREELKKDHEFLEPLLPTEEFPAPAPATRLQTSVSAASGPSADALLSSAATSSGPAPPPPSPACAPSSPWFSMGLNAQDALCRISGGGKLHLKDSGYLVAGNFLGMLRIS